MNYNFKIGKGLDDINFYFSVNEIIQLLGKPEKITDYNSPRRCELVARTNGGFFK